MTDIVKAQAIKDSTMAYFILKTQMKTVYFFTLTVRIIQILKKEYIGI